MENHAFDVSALLDPPAGSLWNPNRSSPYNGTINTPISQRVEPDDDLLIGAMHPGRAVDREVSKNTDLVGGRPWQASAALTESTATAGD